jgi:DNA-binding response OmpR family regulator
MAKDVQGSPAATILVIDDDLHFLDLASEVLGDDGYHILLCQDVTAGLSLLEQEYVDLVILDLRFDTLESGWDVLDYLRIQPALRTVAVIVCSAAVSVLRGEGPALEALGISVLPKPFDIDAFSRLVKTALGQGSDRHSRT